MTVGLYIVAALAEIAGCYAFWAWLKLDKPWWYLIPGFAFLVIFAVALSFVEGAAAGRTYATYGGIYIVSALLWLWFMEGVQPDHWDILGGAICLIGSAIIYLGPR